MNVAVIPARGGSKRIPGKNIKPFAGRPMIAYSIEAALNSGLFHRVLVTTDSEEIAAVARDAGAYVPMLRPAPLADDHTATLPVLEHALTEMLPADEQYENACCILATAPFLDPRYLVEGFDALVPRVNSVLSVTSFPYPIYRALHVDDTGHLQWVWPQYAATRSNDLPEALHDAGQFFWFRVARFLKTKQIVGDGAVAVRLPRHLVQDIDTVEDWETAEQLYRAFFAAPR